MSITISAKKDYSYLFSSLSSSGQSSNLSNLLSSSSSLLTDYASIKNGSYSKLMNAYYNETGKKTSVSAKSCTNKSSTSISKDTAKVLSNIENASDDLKESADKLIATGTKSLFTKQEITDKTGVKTTGYNTDNIYNTISNFVDDYNTMIKTAGKSTTTSIANKLSTVNGITNTYSKQLAKIGITVNSDHSLSVSEETFKASNMDTVKSLFNGRSSFAYSIDSQASMLNYIAQNEASKGTTYNNSATYTTYNAGDIFSSYV